MSATELTPSQRYAEGVARGDWQNDPAQHAALAELDRIHLGLVDSAEDGWLDRLSSFWKKPEPVKGLYFWGGVGRGKTFLVDLFYDGLPIKQKYRTHFHRFMRSVHERLREHQGQSDPLAKIAQEWRSNLRVLVLDEFFVTDIGDAMLLARLLEVKPHVLILDEPTRGVDIGSKSEIYRIINELAKAGVGIVVISSELPEIIGTCDRVLIMREGQLVAEVGGASGQEISQERIIDLATGGEQVPEHV